MGDPGREQRVARRATAPDVAGPITATSRESAIIFCATTRPSPGPFSTGVSPRTSCTSTRGLRQRRERVPRPRQLLLPEEAGATRQRSDDPDLQRPGATDRLERATVDEPAPAVDASAAATIVASASTTPPRPFIRPSFMDPFVDETPILRPGLRPCTRPQRSAASTVAGRQVTCQYAPRGAVNPTGIRNQGLPLRAVTPVVEAIDLHRTYRTTTGTSGGARSTSRRCAGSASRSRKASSSASARTAPARRPRSRCSSPCSSPPPATRVLGHDVVDDAHWVRERIGYVFGGDRGLYERLSALDNLRYFAELYGVDPKRQRERIGELLELSASRAGRRSGSRATARYAPAAPHRPRPAPRPARPLPRRADDRRRPRRREGAPPDDRRAEGRWEDSPLDDPLHVRGRPALRPDRCRREGTNRRRGNASHAI